VRAAARPQRLSAPFIAALVLLLMGVVLAQFTEARDEIIPERQPLSSFPLRVADWQGREQPIEQIYLDTLKLSDYIMVDYRDPASEPGYVNLYVAYYESQRKGASVHSPRSCIPGGGWRITDFSRRELAGVLPDGSALAVNRAIITRGSDRQLVYYWFQQRGRHLTNEYAVKWYLFWDALTRNRSDGALIRVTTVLEEGSDPRQGDEALAGFVRTVHPQLAYHLPD
jgi:EpsI family protein